MATTSPGSSRVSAIEAAREALEHTRRNLFPLRVRAWLVLGLLAFLDQCGRGVPGGAPGTVGDGGPARGWAEAGTSHGLQDGLRAASAWLSEHAVVVAIGVLLGLILVVGILALVLWVNARGTFMYLDNVASGRADIRRPWRAHAQLASTYFAWRLGLSLATLLALLFAAGLIVVVTLGFVEGRLAGPGGGIAALALLPVLLMLLLALPLLALAGLALRDFVAPLQLTTGLACGPATRILEGLATEHPGAFLVYLLLKLVLYAVTGLVVVIGGCLTCCLGFLPVVMQSVFQPLFYFERAWSICLLRQMGHDLPRTMGT